MSNVVFKLILPAMLGFRITWENSSMCLDWLFVAKLLLRMYIAHWYERVDMESYINLHIITLEVS